MILTLKIAPNVMLPTKPSMRIVKILGERRVDIPMEILNTTALHFYHVQNLNEEIKNCNKNPKLCTQFLTFEHLGTGTNIESGSASPAAHSELKFRKKVHFCRTKNAFFDIFKSKKKTFIAISKMGKNPFLHQKNYEKCNFWTEKRTGFLD